MLCRFCFFFVVVVVVVFFSPYYFFVQALLQGSYQSVNQRIANEEARVSRMFVFKVKKPQKKTEVLEKEVLYKKRVITVDWNDPPSVRYRSSGALAGSGKLFPGPDRVLRVSIELDNELALQFFFDNASWKNKTQLRIFFRSKRERDIFLDVYMALPPSADEVSSQGAGGKQSQRDSLNLSQVPAQEKISVFVVSSHWCVILVKNLKNPKGNLEHGEETERIQFFES